MHAKLLPHEGRLSHKCISSCLYQAYTRLYSITTHQRKRDNFTRRVASHSRASSTDCDHFISLFPTYHHLCLLYSVLYSCISAPFLFSTFWFLIFDTAEYDIPKFAPRNRSTLENIRVLEFVQFQTSYSLFLDLIKKSSDKERCIFTAPLFSRAICGTVRQPKTTRLYQHAIPCFNHQRPNVLSSVSLPGLNPRSM